MNNFLKHLLNIIYPRICMICRTRLGKNAIDNLICPHCWAKIKKNTHPVCAICGRKLTKKHIHKKVCPDCQRQHFFFDRAFSPCVYEGIIRQLIHKFKYQNKDYLSALLSKLLIEFMHKNSIMNNLFDLIVPVPLHRTKLREREFNQSELLARRIAVEFSIPLSQSNLWCEHHRQPQMELDKELRWANIKGCFALRNPAKVKGKKILLVDDVLTTGATCSEAAFVLKDAGASCVFVLTLAN